MEFDTSFITTYTLLHGQVYNKSDRFDYLLAHNVFNSNMILSSGKRFKRVSSSDYMYIGIITQDNLNLAIRDL